MGNLEKMQAIGDIISYFFPYYFNCHAKKCTKNQLGENINQGCGSGSGTGSASVLDPYSIESVDPDPDPYSESGSGSGSRRA